MGDTLNIILLSRRNNRKIGFKVTTNLLVTLVWIFGFVLVSTLTLLFINTRQNLSRLELENLEHHNKDLTQRLASMHEELSLIHDRFESDIVEDNRQRTFWEMSFIHPDIWSMGVGGIKDLAPLKAVSARNSQLMSEIYQNLDILQGKCRLRLKSLTEIEQRINNRYAMWAHIPSTNPLTGCPVGSNYGYRVDPFVGDIRMHYGVDIGAPAGAPIRASADGVITLAGWNLGLGLDVDIDHGYGFVSRYAHCSSILVAVGDSVKRGQVIAAVGQTGRAKSPHLHYEMFVANQHVNPADYINISSSIFD